MEAESKVIVELSNLKKSYGNVLALKDISFKIYEGEIFGLLGPNGAGKTTLVKILLGLTKRNSGIVKIFGIDPNVDPIKIKSITGVVLEETALDVYLSGRENLEIFAMLYNLPSSRMNKRIDELLSWSGLSEYGDKLVKYYSKGMRRKLDLCIALLHEPKLLILDEPTVGLDVYSRRELWSLITNLKKHGISVLLTTHYLEEANQLCDRICIINKGEVIAIGSPEELKKKFVGNLYVLIVRFKSIPNLNDLKLPIDYELKGFEMVFRGYPNKLWEVVGIIQQNFPDQIEEIIYTQPTLDDVFLKLALNEK